MQEPACTLGITRPNWPDIPACRAIRLLAAVESNQAAQPGSQERPLGRQRKLRAQRRITVRGKYLLDSAALSAGLAEKSTDNG